MSIKPEPVHYHPKIACIRKAHGQKFFPRIHISESDKEAMDELHFKLLQDQFGLTV